MFRSVIVAVTLVLPLTSVPAAPRPKGADEPPMYHPVSKGFRWVYDDGGRERTWEVAEAVTKDGVTLVSVVEHNERGTFPLQKCSVSAKGVFELEAVHFKLEPTCVLKFPVKSGSTWDTYTAKQEGLQGETATVTVGAVEEIEVPAGKFKAVRVEIVVTAEDDQPLAEPKKYTKWFDPEVGLVKMTDSKGWTRVLKSFTKGKKD